MPAAYEEMLAFVLAQLDRPAEQPGSDDDGVLIIGGEPGDVVVRLTRFDVTVAEYSEHWEEDGGEASVEPIVIGSVTWSAISAEAAMRIVKGLIVAAREARLSKYRVCRICEQATPPEWIDAADICETCAEADYGTIH